MTQLASIEAFHKLHDRLKDALDPNRRTVTICGGTGCAAFGSLNVRQAFEEELERRGLADSVSVKMTGCHGFCERARW